jgi:hypothetical protein
MKLIKNPIKREVIEFFAALRAWSKGSLRVLHGPFFGLRNRANMLKHDLSCRETMF